MVTHYHIPCFQDHWLNEARKAGVTALKAHQEFLDGGQQAVPRGLQSVMRDAYYAKMREQFEAVPAVSGLLPCTLCPVVSCFIFYICWPAPAPRPVL